MLQGITYLWNLKTNSQTRNRVGKWLPGAGGGKEGDVGKKVKAFSYKMDKV